MNSNVQEKKSDRPPALPEFSGEKGKDAIDFDVWRYEVNCCVKEGVYTEHAILQAIRNSLKGKARSVLLHVGELPRVSEIIEELEGIYGNVSSSEKVKEQFYSTQQREGETLADYSIRLEQLLTRTNLQLSRSQRDEMLCGRLWSGLRNQELKNMSRYKYEAIRDFNALRREIRQIDADMSSMSSKGAPVAPAIPPSPAETFPPENTESASQLLTIVENKLLKQLQELTGQMKTLGKRVESMEKEFRDFKKGAKSDNKSYYGQKPYKGKDNRKDNRSSRDQKPEKGDDDQEEVNLNEKGSSLKGSK